MINFKDIVTDKNNNSTKIIKINKQNIEVKGTISLEDFTKFVVETVDGCYNVPDDGNISFRPYYRNIMFNYGIVKFFTNINLDNVDANDFWELSISEGMDTILNFIPKNIISELNAAVDTLIDFETNKLITSQKTSFDTLIETVNKILAEMNDDFKGVDIKNLSKTFSRIKDADVEGIVRRLVKENVDKKSIE